MIDRTVRPSVDGDTANDTTLCDVTTRVAYVRCMNFLVALKLSGTRTQPRFLQSSKKASVELAYK